MNLVSRSLSFSLRSLKTSSCSYSAIFLHFPINLPLKSRIRTFSSWKWTEDMNKINPEIFNVIKETRYQKNEEANEARAKEKLAELKKKWNEAERRIQSTNVDEQKERLELVSTIDEVMARLEESRDLAKIFFHIDMDAFYANVEIRDNPALGGIPLAVLSSGAKTMLSTTSYEARKLGIHSGMPLFIAKRIYPDLEVVHPNMTKYENVSKQISSIYAKYDPNFRQISLDEADLNVTEYMEKTNQSAEQLGEVIRNEVKSLTKLTCSIGCSANPFLSKIVSKINKPNGFFQLPNDREAILNFVRKLPVGAVPGIGAITESQLKRLGITIVSHLDEKKEHIYQTFTKALIELFMRASLGLPLKGDSFEKKSKKNLSVMRTFTSSAFAPELLARCRKVSYEVVEKLKTNKMLCKSITISMRTGDFQFISRSVTLDHPTDKEEIIVKKAEEILKTELPLELRMISITISHLTTQSVPQGEAQEL